MPRRAPSVQKFGQSSENQVDFDEANMFHPSAVTPQKSSAFSFDGTLTFLVVFFGWVYLMMDLCGVDIDVVLQGLPGIKA